MVWGKPLAASQVLCCLSCSQVGTEQPDPRLARKKGVSQSIISQRTVCQTSGSFCLLKPHRCCCRHRCSALPPPVHTSLFLSSSNPEQSNNNKNSSGPILLPKTAPSSPSHQSRGCQAESVASAAAGGAVSSDLDRQPLLC